MDKGGPDLQIWPTAIEELKTLEKRPLVLSHYVAC